jgi:DNA-binding response OmpR family regulator
LVANILFVSDDEELAYVCQVVLEAHGHAVEVVTDARRALGRLAVFVPGLLVIDAELGNDEDGTDLAALLRARLQLHAPVVMISSAPGFEEHARAVGAEAFIPKPFASSELLSAIDRLLGGEERRIA